MYCVHVYISLRNRDSVEQEFINKETLMKNNDCHGSSLKFLF